MRGGTPQAESEAPVDAVLACVADVLALDPATLDPDTPLTELGLESFTAVRLRRRLRDDVAIELPLTAFLGSATARTVAGAAADPDGAGGEDSCRLTPIQAAYLVGREPAFPLGGVATFYYHEYDRVPEDDPARDVARLAAAWNELVDRHPMLRLIIGADGRQRVLPSVPTYEIAVSDLRAASDDQAQTVLDELRRTCSHQVLPADRWPLFDIRAALLPDGRTRIFLGVDVLALDLASWMHLMREWETLFVDPQRVLPEPPATFFELVDWRRTDPQHRRRREQDRAYWSRRAPDLPAGPALPWTASPSDLGVPHFTRHHAELEATHWTALQERAAAAGLSPTGMLLSAFGLILQRWGATSAFCLNTTLFDREDAASGDELVGLDTVVGDFTSTVLVEVPKLDLTAWSGFAAYAAALNRQFWTDLDHRSVSGVEVLRDARRDEAGTTALEPSHPVVFTSGIGLAGAGRSPAAWLGREVFGVSQTPQVLLDHIVWDEDGRLRVAWDAVDGALPDGFVADMLAAHVRLLRRLATDEDAWDDPALGWDPSFLPDEPLAVEPFGDAGPLLDDPLRTAATDRPDAPALLSSGPDVTHRQLATRTAATAASLAGLGLGPGDLVAVAVEKGPAQVTAVLGVNASGAGYVPVEPSWPAARVASLCERAGVRHALVAAGVETDWPADVAVHELDDDGTLEHVDGANAAPRTPTPDQLAYVIFTSGSTGQPKGVAIEHRAARTTLDDLVDRFPLTARDRVLGLSAFSFDLSVYDIFAVLGVGGGVVLPDAARQRDPGHWLELMERHHVTVWNTAPALLEMLVEYAEIEPDAARRALEPLRLVLLSADWIPVTLPDRIRALAPQAEVISLGGATEASIWSICFPIGEVDPAWRSIPYGRALRGQSFHVLQADGRPAATGGTGELHIGGDGLARGYVGDPVQTAERFIDHPVLRRRLYRTGDLGRWRPDGTIEFLGRLDRQVKIRGHRIELGEVESVLDRVPGVRHSVARAVPGPDDRPRLIAYVVPAEAASGPDDDELIDLLRANVPEFMVPSRFVRLDTLPITANGKVDYGALANPYSRGGGPEERRSRTSERVGPASASGDATQVTAPGRTSTGPGVVDAAIDGAAERGLALTVSVSPGDLGPVEALEAAADWALGVRAAAARDGVVLAERLTGDGLIAVELGSATRRAIRPVAAAPSGSERSSTRPSAPVAADVADPQVERAIARVLSELLSTPVDVTTPFFRLGATSLTLVLAHRRLRDELDPDLAVVDLFSRPSVRELARFITTRREPAGASTRAASRSGPVAAARPQASHRERRRAARARAAEVAG